jgi:hypothetical protein
MLSKSLPVKRDELVYACEDLLVVVQAEKQDFSDYVDLASINI